MSDAYIQIVPDSTGKKVDNSFLNVGGVDVYRQRVEVYSGETLPGITYEHQKVHEGRYFSGGHYDAALANGSSINILIQLSTQSNHTKIAVTASGDSVAYLFEGTTVSAAGTAVSMSNHNRSSAKVFLGTVTHTPTITLDGTQINGTGFIPGGDKHSGGGGEFGFGNEFILAPSTNYLVRATNISGGAIKISVSIEGYQPTL